MKKKKIGVIMKKKKIGVMFEVDEELYSIYKKKVQSLNQKIVGYSIKLFEDAMRREINEQ